jgi:hypothetical protein
MTTPRDNLNRRRQSTQWGEGREDTIGVTDQGFLDPSGEYPKKDYHYASSVSKYARGTDVASLSVPGGEASAGFDMGSKSAGSVPFTGVKETPSGHVIVVDDTPGAECMMVMHRTGTGVELRPDGSMVVVTKRNRIEVVGGDHALIVEGDGSMTYRGNMTLNVTGDYNVNVGGAYNLSVAGDMAVDVFGGARRRVEKRCSEVILGDMDTRVVGHRASLCLQDDHQTVGGDFSLSVARELELSANGALNMSAKTAFSLVGVSGVVTAMELNVLGNTGTIGGDGMTHYGKVYTGPASGSIPGAGVTYYGNLAGIAAEAMTARNALRADEAHTAFWATGADKANSAVNAQNALNQPAGTGGTAPTAGTTSTLTTDPGYQTYHTWSTTAPGTITPNAQTVQAILGRSSIGIRNVVVDPTGDLVDQLTRINQYQNTFKRTPTTMEIRETLRGRDMETPEAVNLTSQLAAEGRLGPEWDRLTPPGTNRVAGSTPGVYFGKTPIGNQAPEPRSKRFTPKA